MNTKLCEIEPSMERGDNPANRCEVVVINGAPEPRDRYLTDGRWLRACEKLLTFSLFCIDTSSF